MKGTHNSGQVEASVERSTVLRHWSVTGGPKDPEGSHPVGKEGAFLLALIIIQRVRIHLSTRCIYTAYQCLLKYINYINR